MTYLLPERNSRAGLSSPQYLNTFLESTTAHTDRLVDENGLLTTSEARCALVVFVDLTPPTQMELLSNRGAGIAGSNSVFGAASVGIRLGGAVRDGACAAAYGLAGGQGGAEIIRGVVCIELGRRDLAFFDKGFAAVARLDLDVCAVTCYNAGGQESRAEAKDKECLHCEW